MSKLKVKKNEDGKYGFVDDAGNWVIEPKLRHAFIWRKLGVVYFEEQDEDGVFYEGWTIFKLDNPSEYNQRCAETGMGGDYGYYEDLNEPEGDYGEYIEAWNYGEIFRIYPDGQILDKESFEDIYDWDDNEENEDDEE